MRETLPFPGFFAVLCAGPDRIGKAVDQHRLRPSRPFRGKHEPNVKPATLEARDDVRRIDQGQSTSLSGEQLSCPGQKCGWRWNHESLLEFHVSKPLNRLGQSWVIVIESFCPRAIVKFESVASGQLAPFQQAESILESVSAVCIEAEAREQRAKRPSILGIPGQIRE